jgi:RNA polymerase sigma-70 factor (ECF subfamily)
MDHKSLDQHLSQITTAWTVFGQAHAGLSGEGGPARDPAQVQAQARLLQRYGAAVYRYLLGSLRDADAADELFQEFALRFIRGDFHRADQAKGRFRDFLKTSLFRLIVDAQRVRQRSAAERPLPEDAPGHEPPPDAADVEADRQFVAVWRAELLARAWDALAESERETGQPVHTVLRLRTDHPEIRSPEMAERLTVRLGKPVNAGWVRKKLLLARTTFTDALLDAVADSLTEPNRENLEEELIELGLLPHCREALDRRHPPAAGPTAVPDP